MRVRNWAKNKDSQQLGIAIGLGTGLYLIGVWPKRVGRGCLTPIETKSLTGDCCPKGWHRQPQVGCGFELKSGWVATVTIEAGLRSRVGVREWSNNKEAREVESPSSSMGPGICKGPS